MVRLLLIALISISSYSFGATSAYLTPFEKSVVAISLKAQFGAPSDAAEIASRLAERLTQLTSESVQIAEVATFEEFLDKQKSYYLFDDYNLDELPIEALFKQLKNITYMSRSPKVQRQIENYAKLRREQLKEKSLAASSLFLKVLPKSGSTSVTDIKKEIHLQFKMSLEALTSQVMAENPSPQVLILTKLLKFYFSALPIEQKVEIFYRLIQLPLDAKPMDIFLTMVQHAGPQLQKLMQIIGRSEEIPPEFREIFQKLESQGRPVPWWKVERLLKKEGIDLKSFFYFERKALGVGSMAQTHRAQIDNPAGKKTDLVVRFIKPGIERLLEMDHQILIQAAGQIDADPEMKKYNLPSLAKLVEDLHQSVEEELHQDRTIKDQNFATTVYNDKEIISFSRQKNQLVFVVPRAFLFGKNSQLMAQELVIGKKPAQVFEQYAEIYPELYRTVAEKMAGLWIDQAFFKSGFFHADLHQGNILVSVADEAIAVNILDFGMTGKLTTQIRESTLLLALAIKLNIPELIAKHLIKLTKSGQPPKDLTAADFLNRVIKHTFEIKNKPQANSSLEAWTLWAMDQGLDLHYEFLKLNRGLAAIQSLLSHSKSDLTIETLAQKIAFSNKAYVTQLVLKEPLLKRSELPKYFGSLFLNKESQTKTARPLMCRSLFD